MKRLLHYLRPYLKWALCAIGLGVVQCLVELLLPSVNAKITNEIIRPEPSVAFVLQQGGIMLLFVLLSAAATVVAGYFSSRAAMGFGKELRGAIFHKVESFSQEDMNRFGAPSLITRTTNDVQQVQNVVMMFMRMMVMAPLMCLGGVVMALSQDVALSWVIVAALPLIAGLIVLAIKKGLPYFMSMQKKIDRINLVLREVLSGMRVIRAFGRTHDEERRFEEANLDLKDVSTRVGKLMGIMMPGMMLILNLVTVAILWFGSKRIDMGAMNVGAMQAFINYATMILMSLMMLSMIFVMLPRAQASAERIVEVLSVEPSMEDPEHPAERLPARGEVAFEDVRFAYPGAQEDVLSHIAFTSHAGETTAIIGSTGSGKSTLIDLIPRMFDVSGGRILLSGTDVRDMTQAQLRARIGYVPQKAFLFSGTIRSNLNQGLEGATDEQMWQALRTAQAEDFVRALPDGLDAPVAQGGTNFSGGQRQRLCIARALIRHPEVYIFDDSFSALDFETDARLRRALAAQTKEAAVFIVAQRISTIRHADRIVVLDDGRIAGIGTHEELMEGCEVYRQIALSQHAEEEKAS